MLERFLILWLCLLSLVAYRFPEAFLWSQPGLTYLFAATMFAIGWMLPREEVRQVFRRWPMVLAGTAIQFGVMPVLAYSMGRLFQLGPELMIGMVLVGCVPGAMASNVLTLAARGNVSYSVSLTTAATLASPLVVPLVLELALPAAIDASFLDRVWLFLERFWQMCATVVLPVVAGQGIGRRFDRWREHSRRVGSTVANLTILWIIAVVVAANRDNLAGLPVALLLALLSVNLLGYLAGFGGATLLRLPEGMRRALTLEIGTQNAGLGATLASAWFASRPEVALPPALYTFGCMLTGTVLARLWAMGAADALPDSAPASSAAPR